MTSIVMVLAYVVVVFVLDSFIFYPIHCVCIGFIGVVIVFLVISLSDAVSATVSVVIFSTVIIVAHAIEVFSIEVIVVFYADHFVIVVLSCVGS